MKRKAIVIIVLTLGSGVHAQEVIATQGGSYSNSSATIDFTLGEVSIDTGSDGTTDITQGFHQTNWNFAGLEDQAPEYEAIIFPNPTQDVLNIAAKMFENVSYTLYDAQGKLVMQDKLSAELTPIEVSQLAPGLYALELVFQDAGENIVNSSKRKTFKLIKTK